MMTSEPTTQELKHLEKVAEFAIIEKEIQEKYKKRIILTVEECHAQINLAYQKIVLDTVFEWGFSS